MFCRKKVHTSASEESSFPDDVIYKMVTTENCYRRLLQNRYSVTDVKLKIVTIKKEKKIKKSASRARLVYLQKNFLFE